MAKKEPSQLTRDIEENRQRGKESNAVLKRAKQLAKLQTRTSEEEAELARLMSHDIEEKRNQLLESFTQLMNASTK